MTSTGPIRFYSRWCLPLITLVLVGGGLLSNPVEPSNRGQVVGPGTFISLGAFRQNSPITMGNLVTEKSQDAPGEDRRTKLDVQSDVRVLNNGWDTGQFLVYHEHIFRPVSYAVGLKILSTDFMTNFGKMPTEFQIKTHYGNLWIEDTDFGLEWKAITPSGQLLHLDLLQFMVEHGENPNENRSWVGHAVDVKHLIPTRMLGANYIFPEDRRPTGIPGNHKLLTYGDDNFDGSLINYYYQHHWLPDPADREEWEKVQAKCLVNVVVTKGIVVKVNPNRNSGKTTSSVCDKAVLGSYVTEFPKALLNPRNEADAIKHIYRNRHARAFTLAETDQFTIANETAFKTWTGRDPMDPPFKKVAQVPFKNNTQIWGAGSNQPFAPENGRNFESFDRLFYLPTGQVVPKADRIRFLEDQLTVQNELDLRLSYLIDKWIPSAITADIVKTPNIRKAEMYARLVHESVDLFLDVACITGVSEKFQQIQRLTCDRVQSLYAYFVRAIGVKLCRELRFDREENGELLSDSALISVFNMADPLEFKKLVDKRIGPANDSNRLSSGRSWPNLIVKFPVIFFAQNEAALEAIGSVDKMFEVLDRIQTEEDAAASVKEYSVVVDAVKMGLIAQPSFAQAMGLTWEQAALLNIWSSQNGD